MCPGKSLYRSQNGKTGRYPDGDGPAVAGVKKGKKRNVSKGDATDVAVNKRLTNSGHKITINETENSLEIESLDSRIFPLILSIIFLSAGILMTIYQVFTGGEENMVILILLPTAGMGAAIFVSAIVSLNTRFIFDKERNTLTYSWWAPARKMKTDQCSISDITLIRVREYKSEGTIRWWFEICVKDGREFELKPSVSSWEELADAVEKISSSFGLMIERKDER